MARFYGSLQGRRGEATRLGDSKSGLHVSACSWQGRVETILWADGDKDMIGLRAEHHGSSSNPVGPFFTGTFEDLGVLIDWWHRKDEINAVMALLSSGEIDQAAINSVREG